MAFCQCLDLGIGLEIGFWFELDKNTSFRFTCSSSLAKGYGIILNCHVLYEHNAKWGCADLFYLS